MKKIKLNKRIIIIVLVAIAIISLLGYFTYRILNDENKLTVEEKEWITENVNKVQNIYVPNNLDIFGKNGSGLFYDFLKDLENDENIKTPRKYNHKQFRTAAFVGGTCICALGYRSPDLQSRRYCYLLKC